MSAADAERREAARLPEGDVVAILLEQHARIRDLFEDVKSAEGEHKQQAFDELRALLAVHETAEEMIVRPVAQDTVGKEEAEARNHEEEEANKVLARLEKMDVTSPDFDAQLMEFERSVSDHAEHEEREEFPGVRAGRTEEQLRSMGTRLRAAEKIAPTHPHPSAAGSPAAQWTVGPFASLVDRTRDAINAATGG
ncbi:MULTISPECIES: hemerythrin domain-containing protein [unclassified Streptomyces]|uniref:hemerythrin domain-containing protein n=1 Tax=unclassified Streptomyces TaxID=2593676 RepID=UPI00168B8537|nr:MULTISPECIES: hemerythrin domain-containing protein [unclassified Streptomyces]MBD3003583.1 hemerythrin domain-containing protein [Streptomyces sp. 5-10]